MGVSIYEGEKTVTGGAGIEVTANKVINLLLRSANNLIKIDGNNEVYTDLQLEDGLATTDTLPVGVTTGRVLEADGWVKSGTMLCFKTTSGDYVTWIYGDDGKLYIDNGTGTFKQIYLKDEVDALFTQLRSEISAVGYSGEYNDLLNKPTLGTAAALDIGSEPGNIPVVKGNGRLDPAIIPNVTSHTFVVDDVEDLVTLSQAAQGDMAIVTNASATYILSVEPYSVAANWILLPTPTSDVTSVNGQRGDVQLTTNDVPVQGTTNMYVTSTEKSGWNAKLGYNDVATVATTGNYNDLNNKPAFKTINNSSIVGNGNMLLYSGGTVTLTIAGWDNNTQTISMAGITSNNYVIVSPTPSSMDYYADSEIYCSAQNSDSLTFKCNTTPTSDIDVNILFLN